MRILASPMSGYYAVTRINGQRNSGESYDFILECPFVLSSCTDTSGYKGFSELYSGSFHHKAPLHCYTQKVHNPSNIFKSHSVVV